MTHSFAPVILFVYNRPVHTQQTVASLLQCKLAAESELFVFSDAPKTVQDQANVQQVRAFVQSIQGFKRVSVVERKNNLGLAQSVIDGVTAIITQYGKAIVLEDDMVFASDFLVFLNEALQIYQNHSAVFSISGYSYPIAIPDEYTKDVYLLPRASSWGWATWADRWATADWEVREYAEFLKNEEWQKGFAQGGKDLVYMLIKQQKGMVNSWAVRWSYTHFKNNAYCLFPRKSKLNNIGNDRSGTHSPRTKRFNTELSEHPAQLDEDLEINQHIIRNLQKFFQPSLYRKLINYYKLRF